MEYKTDFLLVHLARAGDEDACEKLVKKYYSSIYQYCLLHIYDPYEAEDLTQEVFTRFFSNLYRYKEYGKVKNYLYTIAGNTVKNYYKKKKDIPSEELLESEESGKNYVEELGVRLTIEQAVRKLPEEIRETAVLYFFQELKQFGDYMKLPPKEQQKGHHDAAFLDLDHPYEQYKGIHYCCKK